MVFDYDEAMWDMRCGFPDLSPAECLVSTFIAADVAELLPSATTIILWPTHSIRMLLDQLSWRRPGRDVTVVELHVTQPLDVVPTEMNLPSGEV
ncbi:hypothetical protein [Amycolatopsis orientalis]|uniref:hypothetical protein n=1 Tax=Amycolatopsis orientalis TaxID=31958 RepID=UPI000564BBD3|nr:hypothetical protein [Amycolatopsis orientalis]